MNKSLSKKRYIFSYVIDLKDGILKVLYCNNCGFEVVSI